MMAPASEESYSAAISHIDVVDQINRKVMPMWYPRQDAMTILLHSFDNEIDSTEHGRVRKDLDS